MDITSIPPSIQPPTQPAAPTAVHFQNVASKDLSRAQQDASSASDSAASIETRPRPVFKMKRTGHSGLLPFSGLPALKALNGNRDTVTPSPSSPSFPISPVPIPRIPSPGNGPTSKSPSGMEKPPTEGARASEMNPTTVTLSQHDGIATQADAGVDASRPAQTRETPKATSRDGSVSLP
jgi:hypothetical protein